MIKVFNRWDATGIKVDDKGLQKYISLEPKIVMRAWMTGLILAIFGLWLATI